MGAIQAELDRLYREKCNGMDTLVRFTPLELEHLNTLTSLGLSARRSSFLKQARKEKRKFTKWERHLCKMDRMLWKKIREAEKIAFKEQE